MRWLVVAALVGCGSSGGKSLDAKVTPDQCEATFEAAVDRSCGSAGDCVLLAHPDCCGDVMIGVSASGSAAAATAEQTYDACTTAACGARGCQHQTWAEDHMVPSGSGQMIVPVCLAQRCSSTVQ